MLTRSKKPQGSKAITARTAEARTKEPATTIDDPKLWLVCRSANARTHRGPRLYWLAIALNGPKQVTLEKPYCGRISFKRSELDSWGLSETPDAAITLFRDHARRWHANTLKDLGRAERALACAEHLALGSLFCYAKR